MDYNNNEQWLEQWTMNNEQWTMNNDNNDYEQWLQWQWTMNNDKNALQCITIITMKI